MANLFEYLNWRGDLDFSLCPPNPVDYLIFSQVSYLPFDGIVPSPEEKEGISLHLALELLLERHRTNGQCASGRGCVKFMFKEDQELINALLASDRYKDCYLLGYMNQIDEKVEKQISAYCMYRDKNTSFIVFRGTDLSLVGWKEDFNMAFREVIPAQNEALDYLEKMASMLKGDLHIAGHSKGGNLAIYASSFCSNKIQKRIQSIYSFDSPGFHESIITSEGFNNIKNKIHSYVPQSSIVGMMLEHGCDYSVVKSSQEGLVQHLLYTWEVTRNNMVHLDNIDLKSRFVDKTIRDWISSLDNTQREKFIDGVYKILQSTEVKTLHELESSWMLSLGRIIKSVGNLDDKSRKMAMKIIAGLFRSAGHNLNTFFKKDKK